MNSLRKHIEGIERNHAIIDAQIGKLSKLSPDLAIPNSGETEDITDISGLLNSALYGQMRDAADALRALAEVQAGLEGKADKKSRLLSGQEESMTPIDAEFTEMKEDK